DYLNRTPGGRKGTPSPRRFGPLPWTVDATPVGEGGPHDPPRCAARLQVLPGQSRPARTRLGPRRLLRRRPPAPPPPPFPPACPAVPAATSPPSPASSPTAASPRTCLSAPAVPPCCCSARPTPTAAGSSSSTAPCATP